LHWGEAYLQLSTLNEWLVFCEEEVVTIIKNQISLQLGKQESQSSGRFLSKQETARLFG